MRFYEIKSRDTDWKRKYDCLIEAEHHLGLPGITCPTCKNTWANIGMDYPAVTVPVSLRSRLKPRSTTWDEFVDLREKTAPLLPAGLPLQWPGTCFEPAIGRVVKGTKPADFNWPVSWMLLLKKDAYDLLVSEGLKLGPAVVPKLKGAERLDTDLVEVQIEPRVYLSDASFDKRGGRRCGLCGRDPWKLKEPIIAGSGKMATADLVRPANFTTYLFATQRFKDLVESHNLSNVEFREVAIGPQA